MNSSIKLLDWEFHGLEESMIEFNEENLNTITSHIETLLHDSTLDGDQQNKLWVEIHKMLKKDCGFSIENQQITFGPTLISFHRENEIMVQDLQKYVQYFLSNDVPKKNSSMKLMERKLGISNRYIDRSHDTEKNVDNLLRIISEQFKTRAVKYDKPIFST